MLLKNTAGQRVRAQLITAADGSAFAGTVTVYTTRDDQGQIIGTVGSGICMSKGRGLYEYLPSQAETNCTVLTFTFTGTGAIPVSQTFYTETVQHLVDGVWDENLGNHTTENTYGEWYGNISLQVASISEDTDEIQTILADGGRLDLIFDSILADTAEIGTDGAGLTAVPWNTAWGPNIYAEVEDAIDDYGPATSAEVSAVQDVVEEILEVVETTGVVLATGAVDADALASDAVAEIKTGLGIGTAGGVAGHTTLAGVSSYLVSMNAKIDLIDSILGSIHVTGTDGVALAEATCNKIADYVRRRNQANVEASEFGDPLAYASEYGFIQQGQNSSTTVSAGTLTVKKTTGETLATRTITTDAGAEAITGIGT